MRKFTSAALAATLGLALASPAFAQTGQQTTQQRNGSNQVEMKNGAAAPDGTAATSNFTGKGFSGYDQSKTDGGPSQNIGSNKNSSQHGE